MPVDCACSIAFNPTALPSLPACPTAVLANSAVPVLTPSPKRPLDHGATDAASAPRVPIVPNGRPFPVATGSLCPVRNDKGNGNDGAHAHTQRQNNPNPHDHKKTARRHVQGAGGRGNKPQPGTDGTKPPGGSSHLTGWKRGARTHCRVACHRSLGVGVAATKGITARCRPSEESRIACRTRRQWRRAMQPSGTRHAQPASQ